MRHRLGIALAALLLLGLPRAAAAQSSADAYFHRAAQQYVDGTRAAARRTVERGLAEAPDDPRLQALMEKLKEKGRSGANEEGRQSSQQGQQGKGQANASRGGQRNPQANQEEARNQGGPEREGEKGNRAEPGTEQRSGSEASSSSEDGESRSERDGERQADAPHSEGQPGGSESGRLSRAQAERLLRALTVQERTLLREIRRQSSAEQRVEKDW